jgi:beta-mannosidase
MNDTFLTKQIIMRLILLLIPAFFIFMCCEKKPIEWPDMHSGWYFKASTDSVWLEGNVPGLVHTDLLSHQRINNPFYRNNESELQWIGKQEWIYKKDFAFDVEQLNGDQVWLNFEGVDTYSKIYLNDQLIWQTDNMFVGKSLRVDSLLKTGNNTIKVYFASTVNEGLERLGMLDYKLPVSANDDDTLGGIPGKRISVFTRKAPFQFGWDFGPRMISAGIWKSVKLIRKSSHFIKDVQVYQQELTREHVLLRIKTDIYSNQSDSVCLTLKLDNKTYADSCFVVNKGMNTKEFKVSVNDPDLWWPIGYGKQDMYRVEAKLKWENQKTDNYALNFGVRNIEVVQESDSIGESFYFRINGQVVYARGANMVPLNVFPHQVTKSQIREKVFDALDANMNMLRIWGGGIYPDEYFYHLCDSLGILVWQDFMFACSMVPDYPGYFESFAKEAVYNIRRLRNHPSLALWCGNNEVVSAWNNWGWKKREEKEQGVAVANRIWNTYDSLFHKFIPEILRQHDPERFYWSSSPQSAPGVKKSDKSGDRHYWMVWWGERPFDEFYTNTGRFMSEYGFQSIPSISSLRKMMRENDLALDSEGFLAHQKSTGGNNRLKNYLNMYYPSKVNFESFPYLTQLLQARAMQTAIQAHRTLKPDCMGSLLWQMNDVWPAVSWSLVDFYGEKKAAYYSVKESFRPVGIFADTLNNPFRLIFVCDKKEPTEVSFTCNIKDFYGQKIAEFSDTVAVDTRVNRFWTPSFEESVLFDWSKHYIEIEYNVDGVNDRKVILLKNDHNLILPKTQFSYELAPKKNRIELSIQSPVFIRSMYISFPPYDVRCNNNYFDMQPNEKVIINIQSKVAYEILEASIRFKTINGFTFE